MEANLKILSYSDRAVVVIGDTRKYKEALKAMGGRWNPNLSIDSEESSSKGWIFSKKKLKNLKEFVANPDSVSSTSSASSKLDINKLKSIIESCLESNHGLKEIKQNLISMNEKLAELIDLLAADESEVSEDDESGEKFPSSTRDFEKKRPSSPEKKTMRRLLRN